MARFSYVSPLETRERMKGRHPLFLLGASGAGWKGINSITAGTAQLHLERAAALGIALIKLLMFAPKGSWRD